MKALRSINSDEFPKDGSLAIVYEQVNISDEELEKEKQRKNESVFHAIDVVYSSRSDIRAEMKRRFENAENAEKDKENESNKLSEREQKMQIIISLCEKGDSTFQKLGRRLSIFGEDAPDVYAQSKNQPESHQEKTIVDIVNEPWFDDISSVPFLKQDIGKYVAIIDLVRNFKRETATIAAIKLFDETPPKKEDGTPNTPKDIKDLFTLKVEMQVLQMELSVLKVKESLKQTLDTLVSLQYELVKKDVSIPKTSFEIQGDKIRVEETGDAGDVKIDEYTDLFNLMKNAGFTFVDGTVSEFDFNNLVHDCIEALSLKLDEINKIDFGLSRGEIEAVIKESDSNITKKIFDVL